jgi:hypothetical protein
VDLPSYKIVIFQFAKRLPEGTSDLPIKNSDFPVRYVNVYHFPNQGTYEKWDLSTSLFGSSESSFPLGMIH